MRELISTWHWGNPWIPCLAGTHDFPDSLGPKDEIVVHSRQIESYLWGLSPVTRFRGRNLICPNNFGSNGVTGDPQRWIQGCTPSSGDTYLPSRTGTSCYLRSVPGIRDGGKWRPGDDTKGWNVSAATRVSFPGISPTWTTGGSKTQDLMSSSRQVGRSPGLETPPPQVPQGVPGVGTTRFQELVPALPVTPCACRRGRKRNLSTWIPFSFLNLWLPA